MHNANLKPKQLPNLNPKNQKADQKTKTNQPLNFFANFFWGALVNGGSTPGATTYSTRDMYNPNTLNYETVKYISKASGDKFNFHQTLVFAGAGFRYNVLEPSDEKSVGIDFNPQLAINNALNNNNDHNFVGGQFPLMVSYNSGCGATYNSRRENGFGIGLGVQYIKSNIVVIEKFQNSPNSETIFINSYLEPVVSIHYRYLSRNDALRDWHIKFGYSSVGVNDKYKLSGTQINPYSSFEGNNPILTKANTFSVRIATSYYFGY
jgi:hypothetical protein